MHLRAIFAALLLLVLAGCQHATTQKPPEPQPPKTVYSSCLKMELPADTEVTLLGANYGRNSAGEIPSPKYMDREDVRGQVNVMASNRGVPQIFFVSGGNAIIWNFANVPPSRIKAVIADGYGAQVIEGLSANVPAKYGKMRPFPDNGGPETDGDENCSSPHYAYRSGPEMEQLVEHVEKVTGLKVTRIRSSHAPVSLDIDAPQNYVPHHPEPPFKGYDDEYKHEDMDKLVAAGAIRLATKADADAWNASAGRHFKTSALIPYVSEYLWVNGTYVVLKPVTLPPKMYGAGRRRFIIPAGVPKPIVGANHNAYYFLETGTCEGDNCDELDRFLKQKRTENPLG